MPIVVAPFVAIAIGAIAAIALPSERASDERRARSIVWLLVALSLAPNLAYFLCAAPDWSVGYVVRAARIPSAILLVVACAVSTLAAGGFHVSHGWIQAGEGRRPLLLAGGSLLVALVVGAGFASRLWLVGTTAQLRSGAAMPTLVSSYHGLALIALDGLTVLGIVAALTGVSPAAPRPREPVRLGRERR